jgi:hypothetical protein
MGRMFGDKLIREEKMVVKIVEDGIVLSDLHLAGMILACVEGTACYKAIPREGSNTRFLFYINGDKDKIGQFVEYWFSGDKKNVNAALKSRAEELRKYGNIISMLKALLDKSRADRSKEQPAPEPLKAKPAAEEKAKNVVN